ncbi:uncharacterized protein [Bemisia tabaci]|uniref:uncharacterized protein n=1 Tax=Bemisia tabaci TaxID=7038 RepID=UPI003B28B67D
MCLCVQQRRLYSPSRMELFSKVKILRYFFIFLASSFFYHTGESMKPDDPAYVSAFNQIIKGATCRTITPKTGQLYKNRFDGDCSRAFAALTSIGLNVCTGWRGAACRRMSNTWECSALVPVSRGMEITRTLDSCGPNLPPPRDPRLRCFTGAGQTSGTRKRRHSPPALPVGSSKITRFNPGPPSAHQASGSSLPPGVPPYTEGFSVGSSSSSIPPFSQRATSSFDVTQITRLGISRDDLQSFANPSHVAQPTRLGTGGPSGVSGQVQSQGRGQSYSLGQEINQLPKSFECDKCDKKYVNKESLTRHMEYHTGQTICPFCTNGKRYGTKDALRSHIRSKHPKEWSAPPQK